MNGASDPGEYLWFAEGIRNDIIAVKKQHSTFIQ